MAIYCPGCNKFDISNWSNNRYVGGSATWGGGSTTDTDYVFCFSCWDAFEDLVMNTSIDKAALILCSAHASAGTASWKSGLSTALLYVAGISTAIDQL